MARLVVDAGPNEGMVFPLGEGVTTIGRSSSNLIPLSDKRSSRFHAEIVRRHSSYQLRDAGSRNGTSVNGVRLTDEYVLCHGDQVRVGQTLFVFEDEEQMAASSGLRQPGSGTSTVRLADETPTQMCGSVRAGLGADLETVVARDRFPEGDKFRERAQLLLRLLAKVRSVFDLDRLLNEIMELIFGTRPDLFV